MSLTCVVVSHGDPTHILGQLRYQTRKPDEILVYCCCWDAPRVKEQFPEAQIFDRPRRGDWGHADRSEGLNTATCDYVTFFNSDDSYEPSFVQVMLGLAETHDADVVYTAWNEYPQCEFRLGSSTSGNFIVRREVALAAGGWPSTPVYENDGHFIDAVAAIADPIVFHPEVLYHHNVPGFRRIGRG